MHRPARDARHDRYSSNCAAMAPPKQKATASYELIETGGGRSAGATSTRPARLVARFRGNDRSSAPSPCRRPVPPSRTTTGSFSDQAGRVSSIWVSACVGLPGVGAGPGRGIWEGQVASVRPWAAFGRPRGLERGHSGGSMYKVGFGRGRLLPTSVVLIDLY